MEFRKAFRNAIRAVVGPAPVNSMNASDVQYIQQKVCEQTKFDVGCQDTRLVNGRENVGLVMPETTPAEEVAKAEDVFITAAKDRGIEIDRKNILHYVPGTISPPSRFVQLPPKTW